MSRIPKPTAAAQASLFRGYFDQFEEGVAGGWVMNAAAPLKPVTVYAVIDGQQVGHALADTVREDIRSTLGHPTGAVGFRYAVPAAYLDGKPHVLSFRLVGGAVLRYLASPDPGGSLEALSFAFRRLPKVHGHIDGFRQGRLKGWVLRQEPDATSFLGGCHLQVTCNGRRVAQVRANQFRGDVMAATGGDPNCGFAFEVPRSFRSPVPQAFRIEVMPEGIEIEGSPVMTSTVDDRLEESLLRITGQIDSLHRELSALRRGVTDLVPTPGYTLADYDPWARAYYPVLRARVDAERARRTEAGEAVSTPLVSVIVPTYRPRMADFVAAVESVISQTYQNWELVIVDDCSRDAALSAEIKAFCKRDKRIRSVVRRTNGNISEATNTGIEAARGDYVAFFDHDDMLVDVALEMMVEAALRTGARVLYSDEDKVDKEGYYLEPNFKPDWNYRYMLGVNYVCHLLFVERSALGEVGPLRSKYDGAQDHDLILRLSEVVPRELIHHVPEVLYHWRKTPNSTASDISHKSYAVDAGVLAVSDHLKRRGIKATVQAIPERGLYRPVWQVKGSPKVTIIIPFKDEIDTTRRCLETVLTRTDYANFDVILVNNWSMTQEGLDFVEEVSGTAQVRVLTVEEGFNYSRLNNLAVAQTDAELLVFMNNDLFPETADWLRLLVNELLVDPGAAAVGGLFLYPNGTVQHAGVAVGEAGPACHVHKWASGTDAGYMARVVLSQELTAVTGACMLVRASVFREVGGFDEVGFKVAFNDVDLCLKIRAAGHRILYCAEMVAVHHESLSRGSDDRPEQEGRFFEEQQLMLERWGSHPLFVSDPGYNPHFVVDRQTFFDLRSPE